MRKLTFHKILIFIGLVHQKNVLFATIGVFWTKGLSFNWMFTISINMY